MAHSSFSDLPDLSRNHLSPFLDVLSFFLSDNNFERTRLPDGSNVHTSTHTQWSGVGRVVYGCAAAQLEALSGPGGFDVAVEHLYGLASAGARHITVAGPYLAHESLTVHDSAGVWKYPYVKATAES
jgi:hypothetical protein